MKNILWLTAFSISLVSVAHAEICGTVKSFVNQGDDGTGFFAHKITFNDGKVIPNAVLELGEQSLIAASLTNAVVLCFSPGSSGHYELSSASK